MFRMNGMPCCHGWQGTAMFRMNGMPCCHGWQGTAMFRMNGMPCCHGWQGTAMFRMNGFRVAMDGKERRFIKTIYKLWIKTMAIAVGQTYLVYSGQIFQNRPFSTSSLPSLSSFRISLRCHIQPTKIQHNIAIIG